MFAILIIAQMQTSPRRDVLTAYQPLALSLGLVCQMAR